jgi:hypothetical protein
MTKPITSIYKISATIPANLISPLLELLRKKGGHVTRMSSRTAVQARQSSLLYKPGSAADTLLTQLREEKELHSTALRKAFEAKGFSPHSVGPICHMLQRHGRVYSPRRGFWRLRV